MSTTININWEITDTFGGEANYCWVQRGTIAGDPKMNMSDLAIVRRVKKLIGWNGVKCRVDYFGDNIAIYPAGMCQVCFISFYAHDDASAD